MSSDAQFQEALKSQKAAAPGAPAAAGPPNALLSIGPGTTPTPTPKPGFGTDPDTGVFSIGRSGGTDTALDRASGRDPMAGMNPATTPASPPNALLSVGPGGGGGGQTTGPQMDTFEFNRLMGDPAKMAVAANQLNAANAAARGISPDSAVAPPGLDQKMWDIARSGGSGGGGGPTAFQKFQEGQQASLQSTQSALANRQAAMLNKPRPNLI